MWIYKRYMYVNQVKTKWKNVYCQTDNNDKTDINNYGESLEGLDWTASGVTFND